MSILIPKESNIVHQQSDQQRILKHCHLVTTGKEIELSIVRFVWFFWGFLPHLFNALCVQNGLAFLGFLVTDVWLSKAGLALICIH